MYLDNSTIDFIISTMKDSRLAPNRYDLLGIPNSLLGCTSPGI